MRGKTMQAVQKSAYFLMIVLALVMSLGIASAFSGPEHRRVSATAFDVALRFARAKGRTFTVDEENVLAAFRGQSDESYAGLVVAIDHTVDPLRVLERAIQTTRLPHARSDLDPFIVSTVLNPELAGLRAITINDMHFQAELTTNLRLYHLYAVLLAAHGEPLKAGQPTDADANNDPAAELFSALVINAISDHLLQDFFAPGHIITPRYGVHDAVALGSHEKYNLLGSTFVPDPVALCELEPLAKFLPQDTSVIAYIAKRYKIGLPR
jgi:hypothetical protein